jgi:hypothetical protein
VLPVVVACAVAALVERVTGLSFDFVEIDRVW